MNIIISIKIEVQGQELELTIDEAVKLHDELEKVVGRSVTVQPRQPSPLPWKPPTVTPYVPERPSPQKWWGSQGVIVKRDLLSNPPNYPSGAETLCQN